MKRLLSTAACLIWTIAAGWAQEYAPNHLLVKPLPGVQAQDFGATLAWTFDSGAQLWILPNDWAVQDAGLQLEANGLVEYAEPDPIVRTQIVPSDPAVLLQWQWPVIHAFDAWDVTTGSRAVKVAVIDSGTDYRHDDLAANIWINPGDIPGNGLDDDANGCVDDVHGCDFYGDVACSGLFQQQDGDPMDRNGHGTHTAGTIGEVGNNQAGYPFGYPGVNWYVTLIPVRFLGEGGGGYVSDAIKSIDYARRIGVDVMSNSWGCGPNPVCFSQAEFDAIKAVCDAGIVFAAAAGNNNVNTDLNPNFFPADFDLPCIISVAASAQTDERAAFSNYGPQTVDLAAPGVDISSTYSCDSKSCLFNSFINLSGTSMATPHVAGAAALIKSIHPDWKATEIKAAILGSVDVLTQWSGLVGTNGRLNLAGAVGFTQPPPPPPPPPNPCGNGICDDGETCRTCAADCPGQLRRKPSTRFCCGDGIKQAPEGDGTICGGNF